MELVKHYEAGCRLQAPEACAIVLLDLTKYKYKGKIIENCILRQRLQSMKPPEQDPGSVGPV